MNRRRSSRPLPAPSTCPVARLAAEYQRIQDSDNESPVQDLSTDDRGWRMADMLRVREYAVEAMAAALPTQSVEGALFQLGLLSEVIRLAYGWKAQERYPDRATEFADAHAAAMRMLFSVRNFLRRGFNLWQAEDECQWFLADGDDPFKAEADMWAKVEADRREEAAKGGAA